MNVAIIVAAGTGSRFGGDIPKIFLELNGIPVIVRTISKFQDSNEIHSIVVVASDSHLERVKDLVLVHGLNKVCSVVTGGDSRSASVGRGVEAVESMGAKLLVVHDGARPLVSIKDIEATIKAASATGAALLVAPVTDTMKEVRDGKVIRTVDRRMLRRAVTPQVFNQEILLAALAMGPADESVTDEALLVEMAGFEIAVVEGDVSNIKITHQADLAVAEALLEKEIAG